MFSTVKNNRCFSIVIPATEKYIPLVRRYVVGILTSYEFGGRFLYQMEIMIDELCLKISKELHKYPSLVWLDIKFEVSQNGFSFDILDQRHDFLTFERTQDGVLEEYGINSPEIGLIERYSDNARLDLINGKISKVKMARYGKEQN